MTRIKEYDYLLINDNFEKALKKLLAIAEASKCKVSSIDSDEFISSWISA